MSSSLQYACAALMFTTLLTSCDDPEDKVVVDRGGMARPPPSAPGTDGQVSPQNPATDARSPESDADAATSEATDAGSDSADAAMATTSDATVTEEDSGATSEPDGSLADAAVDSGPPEETRFCGAIRCDCVLNGIPLFGRVRVVNSLADFDVREDDPFPDLRVEETTLPLTCGQWQFVDALEDFTIQKVTSFGDFSIRYARPAGLAKSPL